MERERTVETGSVKVDKDSVLKAVREVVGGFRNFETEGNWTRFRHNGNIMVEVGPWITLVLGQPGVGVMVTLLPESISSTWGHQAHILETAQKKPMADILRKLGMDFQTIHVLVP